METDQDIKDRLPIAWCDDFVLDCEDGSQLEAASIFDANSDPIAFPNPDLSSMKEWCDFIVKACNLHHDMLAECELMLECLTIIDCQESDQAKRLASIVARAKEVSE